MSDEVSKLTLGGTPVEDLEWFDLLLFMEDHSGCIPDIYGEGGFAEEESESDLKLAIEDEYGIIPDTGENIAKIMVKMQNQCPVDWPVKLVE